MVLCVLLVDDDELALQALARALVVHSGVEVKTATSEALALPLVGEVAFDAVIADLALEASPRGGLAVLQEVRREEAAQGRRRAELLLVTGGEDIAAANVAEGLGARFLHKPFPPEAITRLVDRMRARAVDLDEEIARDVAMLSEAVGFKGREREAFVFMAADLSSSEVQSRMGIGAATEKTYSNRVLARLREYLGIEITNRHELAVLIRERAIRAAGVASFL